MLLAFLLSLFTFLAPPKTLLTALPSPVLFRGDERTAYRDPAMLYYQDSLFVFFTLVRTEADNKVYSYVAMSQTQDLQHWSPVRILTPRDQRLDYSSPGNVVRFGNEWVLCLQTYPRPAYTADQMPRFGTGDARLFTMRSRDLHHWAAPELLRVKSPDVDEKSLGRMIDPYLLQDKDEPGNSLNDATGFHLYEGRWLRDNRYVRDYITYLYQLGGNDRHFSEYIADAAYANQLVNPDSAFITAQLPARCRLYEAWNDHFDAAKGLYYIEPINDATEYTIASIDATGGQDGFRGGTAFRPTY